MRRRNRHWKADYEALEKEYLELLAREKEESYALCALQEEQTFFQKQDEEIRSLHQSMRQLKHDMKNHMMVIASCLNKEEYEEAKTYVSDILDRLNEMHSYIETGNSLMNHILNEKLESARAGGISVKAEIENLAFSRMKSIDFAAVLSNLLDNAIEASLGEPDTCREIQVRICKIRGYDSIQVKNRISVSVLTENPTLCSAKKDAEHHGLGLSQVQYLTKSYHGMWDIYEADGYFCVNVFIPE